MATMTGTKGRRHSASGRLLFAAGCAALVAILVQLPSRSERRQREALAGDDVVEIEYPEEDEALEEVPGQALTSSGQAFLSLDEKDGRYCGKEGDLCKCFGKVRYGRLFSWSGDLAVDGTVNCSAQLFGDPMPMDIKICKCYPTICTTQVGICTPEPCMCATSRDPDFEWAKKTLMTGDGTKCWACERKRAATGIAEQTNSSFCPTQMGRCSLKRSCKCESPSDTKRVMRTKSGEKCWTCAPVGEGRALGMDTGQRAMFWMLPLLWSFMDWPNSFWQVCDGDRALTIFVALCILGYFCQVFAPFLRLDRFFSFYAPCMKKGEFWRFFTYFMLHSDLQHLCVNLFHLMDALDLEGVPDLEVSPGVPLKCTRDGPVATICYPDVGIGWNNVVGIMATVLAFGALLGTMKNFGALVQGASSVCFGVDGALIALYGVFLGAGLDQQLKIPEFGAFFWMRIGIIAFHIVIDIVQSVCGSGKDTVGTVAHMSALVAGFCYVIIFLPPMGDGSFFGSDRPYIVNCGMTSPKYVTLDEATTQCLAFFRRSNGIEIGTAQAIACTVLGTGVVAAIVNAIMKRDISDDGIAVFSCGDSAPSTNKTPAVLDDERSALDTEINLRERALNEFKESVEVLSRFHTNLSRVTLRGDGAQAASASA